jgi:hypothetical protein
VFFELSGTLRRVPEISVTDANAVAKLKIIQANNQGVFADHGGNREATERSSESAAADGGASISTRSRVEPDSASKAQACVGRFLAFLLH